MTALQIAKSRSTARTETHVAFRGEVANPEWEGMSVTLERGDGNGGAWGRVGQPANFRATTPAIVGGTTSVGLSAAVLTDFETWTGGLFNSGTLRVYRPVSGQIELIREASVTGSALDYWSRIGGNNVIAGTTFDYRVDSWTGRRVYTFGVARVDTATGLIGPVATVTADLTNSGYTTLTPATPTTGASVSSINGRNGSLPAVTGLTATIRAGTTHNVELSWTGGAPNNYVILINWNGSNDRLSGEGTLSFASGPAILAGDLLVYESAPILTLNNDWISNRVKTLNLSSSHGPNIATGYNNNVPGGRTWQYVAFDGSFPKPDITYPDYYLQLNGNVSTTARAQAFFHSGTNQSFYDILVPGRTYRAEIVAAAASNVNATFAVSEATLSGSGTVALTTTPQTFTFDFTRATTLESSTARDWTFTAATNNIPLRLLSVRLWDTTQPYNMVKLDLPAGIDVRDHHMIKARPVPSFDELTSRSGFGGSGWSFASLLAVCRQYNCNPHFQVEWLYGDQVYDDLVTFLFAPAASGEPLALKREAQGFGPVHIEFARHLWEGGNEDWNPIMWAMFAEATDSVTAEAYGQGDLSAMFNSRRRAIMKANPYWPTANPPLEFVGGWLRNTAYTVQAAETLDAEYISVAAYTSGTDVNRVLLSDTVDRWRDILTISEVSIRPEAQSILGSLSNPNIKFAVYEAGPGYQLGGLNGATVTKADEIVQEAMTKSVGGTTALMASVGILGEIGVSPYNFFTWGTGGFWTAGRRPSEGGGFYRVADFLKQTYELLGRSRIYATDKFIDRTQPVTLLNSGGDPIGETLVPRATVYHFESLDYPGRHGLLYVNRNINFDAFGVGHPDYQAGVTGEAEFRYHTGLPAGATPFKVLRNEGNFRHHDAFRVGFRPNVVGSSLSGYVADPLCVDLTVTPEDFTVDDPTLRTLTLLGGNCRLEIFTT